VVATVALAVYKVVIATRFQERSADLIQPDPNNLPVDKPRDTASDSAPVPEAEKSSSSSEPTLLNTPAEATLMMSPPVLTESSGLPENTTSSEPTLIQSAPPVLKDEPKKVVPLAPKPDSPFSGEPLPDDSSLDQMLPLRSGVMPISSSAQLRRVTGSVPVKQPDAVLEAKGLIKKFGKRTVVTGVDLQVGAGEIVGLLGRNGAGKTTTFRMIMGLLHPDGGTVTFEHRDITRAPMYDRANRGIGYLAQQPSVFQRMTVEENLLAVLELQEPSREKRKAKVEELISSLGLGVVRKSMAAVLSGGERRRLEIARAMSLNPKIVLFDEPFAGIDPIAVSEIQGILRVLKSKNVGVLLTDHNVRETLAITDRTYIMDEGKIWIHGPPREIVDNAEARSRYLGYDFRLDF